MQSHAQIIHTARSTAQMPVIYYLYILHLFIFLSCCSAPVTFPGGISPRFQVLLMISGRISGGRPRGQPSRGKVSGSRRRELWWWDSPNAAKERQLRTDSYWRHGGGGCGAVPNSGRIALVFPSTGVPSVRSMVIFFPCTTHYCPDVPPPPVLGTPG